jgi:hypothetical protein
MAKHHRPGLADAVTYRQRTWFAMSGFVMAELPVIQNKAPAENPESSVYCCRYRLRNIEYHSPEEQPKGVTRSRVRIL